MATSETSDDSAGHARPPEAPISAKRGRERSLARYGLFAGLFGAALAASWLYREHSGAEEAETVVEPQRQSLKKIDSAGSPVESLARGDEALQRHLYWAALSHYEELLAGDAAAAPLVDYRLGLCHEALGRAERAITAYRKAISTTSAPGLIFASHLGMARCLLQRNEPAQVRRLLYPFLLDETRQQEAPAVFALEARYLVALALARQALTPATARLQDDQPVHFFAIPLEVPLYLEEVRFSSAPLAKKVADEKTPHVAVQKRSDKQPALISKINLVGQSAQESFELVAKEAGLRIEWSAGAKRALADRSPRLCLGNWPVLDLLEQAADHFDLACKIGPDSIRLEARSEQNADTSSAALRALAGRALRAALLADDSHNWKPAAYLELGNCEAVQGNLAEAATWFERLSREAANSAYVAPATYNLAKLHLHKQDYSRARQAFLRVIDHSPGHELALRAQIHIGQLSLEEEDFAQAIVQLRRAQALAPGSAYQPLATLALAAAYLQQAQPGPCRAALAKQRAVLQKEPYKATAAFLDAYAQYHLAKPANAARREASDLLSTLWRDQDETLLGPVGHFLIAQAYRDLGFWDQAERLLRQAAAHAQGPIGRGLEYLLADTLLKQNRRGEATPLLEKLAAVPSTFRTRARLRLAQLDLHDKRYQDCLRKCQELWAEQAVSDPASLLQTWGAALEGMGDFAKAAQCFSGKAPL